MKVKLHLAPTLHKAGLQAINELRPLIEKRERVFVVVPDRASLTVERQILNTLNIKGAFNLSVVTFNTMASSFIEDEKPTLSSLGGVLLVKKILNNNKQNLVCFGKTVNNLNFAKILYKTIQQIKACKISPASFKESITNALAFTKLKLTDIALVYEEYEKAITANFADGLSRLGQLEDAVKTNPQVKNAHFYFLNFDKFTAQHASILKQIIKNAKSVSVACTKSGETQANKDIYLDEVFSLVNSICNQLSVNVEVMQSHVTKAIEEKFMAFIFGAKKEISTTTQIVKTPNFACEREMAVSYILKHLEPYSNEIENGKMGKVNQKQGFCGKNYSDFAVLLSSFEEHKKELASIFESYNIPYYIDESYSLSSCLISKYIKQIFNVFASGFERDCVLDLVKNILFGASLFELGELENYIVKYDVNGAMFFKPFVSEVPEMLRQKLCLLLSEYENFTKAKSSADFISVLEKSLTILDAKTQNEKAIEMFSSSGNELMQKLNQQAEEKLSEVFAEIQMVLGDDEVQIKEFYSILELALEDKKVSTVPLLTNAVFIGDASSSVISCPKHLLIMGASSGAFPVQQADTGLITDAEASSVKLSSKLEPSISTLNKRAIFNMFELVCMPENLCVSFSENDNGAQHKPSMAINELQNIYGLNIQNFNFDSMALDAFECVLPYQRAEKILNRTKSELEDFNLDKTQDVALSLESLIKQDNNENETKLAKFDLNGQTKITEIETYFTCPLKHFLTYGLKLKEQETGLVSAINIGNLYHLFCKKFELLILNGQVKDDNIEELSQSVVNKILETKEFELIVQNEKNKPILKALKKEIKTLAKNLYIHHKNSNFKPYPQSLEQKFGSGEELEALKINDDVSLKGVIDRADFNVNQVRVIDYKTGADKFSLSEFYYGKKLQLLSYLKCYQQNGYQPVGAFYFPISNRLNGKSFTSKLDGIFVKDLDVAYNMDTTLAETRKSELFGASIKKDGNLAEASQSVEYKDFNNLINYSVKIIDKATSEIKSGNISASPVKNGRFVACDFCPYKNSKGCSNAKVREYLKKVDLTSFEGEN